MSLMRRFSARGLVERAAPIRAIRMVEIVPGQGETAVEFDFVGAVWLSTTETQWFVSIDGTKLHKGGTYNDWYGYLTSFIDPLAEAQKFCIDHRIDATHPLRVDVILTETKRLCVRRGEDSLGRPEYEYPPSDCFIADELAKAWIADSRLPPRDRVWPARTMLTEETNSQTLVWSSEREPALNERVLQQLHDERTAFVATEEKPWERKRR